MLQTYYLTWKEHQQTAEKLGILVDAVSNDMWKESEILLASIDRIFFGSRKKPDFDRLSAKAEVMMINGTHLDFEDPDKRPLVENFLSDWCMCFTLRPYEESVKLSKMTPENIWKISRNKKTSVSMGI